MVPACRLSDPSSQGQVGVAAGRTWIKARFELRQPRGASETKVILAVASQALEGQGSEVPGRTLL